MGATISYYLGTPQQLPPAEPLPCPPGKQLWLIIGVDDDSSPLVDGTPYGFPLGGSKKRMEVFAKHKEYQGKTATVGDPDYIKKIMAGPQLTDDSKFMTGSAFIVESTKEEAEAFNRNDPFHTAGVWKSVTIVRYKSVPAGILAHKGV
mmetsp:Transcript_17227/g.22398  ORF Transcript_17227/g.22398 Transcript_17227/m.22398 type:complete len:148 (-) Transcript_17227:191-634(-)